LNVCLEILPLEIWTAVAFVLWWGKSADGSGCRRFDNDHPAHLRGIRRVRNWHRDISPDRNGGKSAASDSHEANGEAIGFTV